MHLRNVIEVIQSCCNCVCIACTAKAVSAAETTPCAHCYTAVCAKTRGTCHRYPSDKTVCVEPSEQAYCTSSSKSFDKNKKLCPLSLLNQRAHSRLRLAYCARCKLGAYSANTSTRAMTTRHVVLSRGLFFLCLLYYYVITGLSVSCTMTNYHDIVSDIAFIIMHSITSCIFEM